MIILDLELQRERRAEMLREAESKRVVGSRRRPRNILLRAGLWAIGR